jgi:ribosomal protein S18 acetylase RimI-like enzyme
MNLCIRPYEESDHSEVIEITLLAFAPIHSSFAKILGPEINPLVYPDWRVSQREGIENIIKSETITLCVAEVEGKIAGYVAYALNDKDKTGEVEILAVHPQYQNQGIGTVLNLYALEKLKAGGMKLVTVGTGGDESHVAARRSYEKSGYTALPLVRYYKAL